MPLAIERSVIRYWLNCFADCYDHRSKDLRRP